MLTHQLRLFRWRATQPNAIFSSTVSHGKAVVLEIQAPGPCGSANRLPVNHHTSGERIFKTGNDSEQCAFPTTAAANNADKLAGRDRQID